ncbi:1,4-alpha-glucan branching enzyme [Jannaschia faecimaris]|uniref:1,4-alpha-glucan branching enzyme GlgB n=1 Tax=Jannaschia faecimaris TaxID=1244108 RepID=A0A1H3RG42_9RHOB|nr:1,4-alpha-glucan branching protein GlgB [Jannaschia faecimaris]SDZ24667.1 1,4-alpha-glucan branching enzyme [Jannaschia faecimaris]
MSTNKLGQSSTRQLPEFLTSDALADLNAGAHNAPFDVLGPHKSGNRRWITAFQPGAVEVAATVAGKQTPLSRIDGDVFSGPVSGKAYTLTMRYADGSVHTIQDPFAFSPVLTDFDRYLVGEGTHKELWRVLGAHVVRHQGVEGVHFAVWAPNARRVSVVGDFNHWDGRRNPMRPAGDTGVWEVFLPEVGEGALYKYEILGADGSFALKADPVGFGSQHPPEKASIVRDIKGYGWKDQGWMKTRAARSDRASAISIYEVHLGSWRRRYDDGGRPLSYKELARDLVSYVRFMGFTHIELLPVSEFPFDGSWGYQPVGLYAPTIRFGPPHEFRDFVEAAHAADIGVLLDWVPGHFPTDDHGLAHFDGTSLYEHADPREGFHQDWNTLIYNYGRREVKNYLVANALYWMEEYHLDGLRVDAVASMLYRDYSRNDGEWVPNKDGGRENYEAIAFLQEMNVAVYGADPSVMTVAEESTSFPAVSQPVHTGGLGFGYKWNMGWMNDTLRYMEKDPIYRQHDHHLMTFPIDWAFTENFILPISHDEVVHGKGSMIGKMPGTEWEKFANLRAYYAFMWMQPGKKLLFMGCEFAQPEEWNHNAELNWTVADLPAHKGVQHLVRDLNALYRDTPALHVNDCRPEGFAWLKNDAAQSTMGFARFGVANDVPIVVMCNFTPVERLDFRVGVPEPGYWEEVLNTDAAIYGGGNRGNLGGTDTAGVAADGHAQSIALTLPPLAVVVLRLRREAGK